MIRAFIDGERMAPLESLKLTARLSLSCQASGERYAVGIEAGEARLVVDDGGATFRRLLLLDDEGKTIANLVNLDTPAEVLAAELAQAFADGDPVAAVERLLGARRGPE